MNVILIAVIILGAVGLAASVMLYLASKKFAVVQDERIGKVAELLPQANCGGCGFPGCAGFASACVKAADAGSLEGKLCPVGGQAVMEKVAATLGMKAEAGVQKVAVIRCNGSCANRPRVADYDGVRNCRIQMLTGTGETACAYGCLGCGDCTKACRFGGLTINAETGLPQVNEDVCTGCGACVKSCPRNIIELRPKGPKGRRLAVMCVNRDKGAVANKICKASCIGCGKCVKVCKFEAVTVTNNLAYIDPVKCKMCRKCEEACPKGAILAVNFPPRKPKPAEPAASETPKAESAVVNSAAEPKQTVINKEKSKN